MTAGLPPEDWPGRAFSRIVPCAPHRWHVQIRGEGPDLLLLHGAGASLHSFYKIVPGLARDFRVIAVDLPGHAYTKSPRGRTRLPQVAADIAVLVTQEGWQPKAIIGHSAGAAIALQLQLDGSLSADRLVVINGALENFEGTAGWLFPILARAMALNPLTAFMIAHAAVPITQVRGIIKSAGSVLPEEDLQLYARLIGNRRHVDGALSMMAQWSLDALGAALPRVDVPVLMLHGEKDGAVPIKVAERVAEALPRARLEILPGVGHIAQEEAPERVAEALDQFLAPVRDPRNETAPQKE
ncbi:MAG: alpha/beta fold hydrolase [Rhodobacteraceae bacterium]|nr:alpha/beta fold hydrolase [Paracoccaceae bacterium]